MHVLVTVFDPVICKTPDTPLHFFVILQGKVATFWRYVADITCIFLEMQLAFEQ